MGPGVEGAPDPHEDEQQPEGLTLFTKAMRIDWSGVEAIPVAMANQFLAQIDTLAGGVPDQVVLSIGQLVAPPLLGTTEEKNETFAAIDSVHVNTLARYSLTPARVSELLGLLQMIQRQFGDAQATTSTEVEP